MFVNYKADSSKPLPMLFQAGYLTIKGYDKEFNTYRLDFPNKEVKQGLITLLANDYLGQEYADSRTLYKIGATFSSKTGTIEEWQTENDKRL